MPPINVVLVSDHGMTAISRDRVIVLSDYLDLAAVDVVDVNPNLAVAPKTMPAEEIYRRAGRVLPKPQPAKKTTTRKQKEAA